MKNKLPDLTCLEILNGKFWINQLRQGKRRSKMAIRITPPKTRADHWGRERKVLHKVSEIAPSGKSETDGRQIKSQINLQTKKFLNKILETAHQHNARKENIHRLTSMARGLKKKWIHQSMRPRRRKIIWQGRGQILTLYTRYRIHCPTDTNESNRENQNGRSMIKRYKNAGTLTLDHHKSSSRIHNLNNQKTR